MSVIFLKQLIKILMKNFDQFEISSSEINTIDGGTFCFGFNLSFSYCAPKTTYCAPKTTTCTTPTYTCPTLTPTTCTTTKTCTTPTTSCLPSAVGATGY